VGVALLVLGLCDLKDIAYVVNGCLIITFFIRRDFTKRSYIHPSSRNSLVVVALSSFSLF